MTHSNYNILTRCETRLQRIVPSKRRRRDRNEWSIGDRNLERDSIELERRNSCEFVDPVRILVYQREPEEFEEAGVYRRMHLGILVTWFVPLLHNRLSRQLGQLSTPPTSFSHPAPLFLPSSFASPLYQSLSLFLSIQCSPQSLLFQPHLSIPSFLF